MKRTFVSSSDEDCSEDKYETRSSEVPFFEKISKMMYTFGDVKEPLKESVKMMHTILREQLSFLLKDAEKAAYLRGSNEKSHAVMISHAEILFLMRRNKEKLKQMLEYINVIDAKNIFHSKYKAVELNADGTFQKNKYLQMCMEFLASIEDCKEFTSLLKDKNLTLPSYYKKRLERRMAMTEMMEINEYKDFSEALQISFCQSPGQLRKWLVRDGVTNLRVTQLAASMISYLARETIAVICDKALLIKANKLKGQTHYCSRDPLDLLYASCNKKTTLMQHDCNDIDFLTNINKELHKMSNKEKFLSREAITPQEIREAYQQLNEPSPLAFFFNDQPLRLKKKIYLLGTSEIL